MTQQELRQAERNSKNAWKEWNQAWENLEIAETKEKEAYVKRLEADAELDAREKAITKIQI